MNVENNLEKYKLDPNRWLRTIPKKQAKSFEKKYYFTIILFIFGLISVSLIKNEANSIHSIPNINKKIPLINIKKLESRFYLRFVVKDQPGVLSKMSNILGEKKISIASVIQKENPNLNSGAELVFMTYKSTQAAIDEAIEKIVKLDIVEELKSVFRVE